MTKLASIQRILSIDPIPGADKIELATILGWQIIVKKDEYKVGDLCTYIQIDTVVPETEEFEFLRQRKFRVRTIKLRGQISQGLIVPVPAGKKWKEDDDVTEVLKIQKYTKDTSGEGQQRKVGPKKGKTWYTRLWYKFWYKYLDQWFPEGGTIQRILFYLFPNIMQYDSLNFPTELVPKTDEERIQNMPLVLTKYRGKTFIVTEKLNGSSITLIYNRKKKSKLRICSRNLELVKPDNNFHPVVQETNFVQHVEKLVEYYKTDNVIVQGEYIGKPQANYHKIPDNQIRLFNIFIDGKRLDPLEMKRVVGELDIPHCPYMAEMPLFFDMKEILEFAQAKSSLNPEVEREGLVFRCTEDNLSFKVISNKYLLDNEE